MCCSNSWLLRNALEGEPGNPVINPAQVLLSNTDLHLPDNITLRMSDNVTLSFEWGKVDPYHRDARDRVILVAYDMLDFGSSHLISRTEQRRTDQALFIDGGEVAGALCYG